MQLTVDQMNKAASLAGTVPKRHGSDVGKARRIARPLRLLVRQADCQAGDATDTASPEPSPQQWQALGQALMRGDPLADRVAHWVLKTGLRTAQPVLERALNLGLDGVPEAPPEVRAFFAAIEATPDWFDPALALEGARVCHLSGLDGLWVLRDGALMSSYQASAINQTLLLTGGLERGPQRRVAETVRWWMDCTTPGGLSRFAAGFKSTARVRLMHALVRERVRHLPEWDTSQLGLPVNQVDMQASYLGFSAVFLMGQRLFGIPVPRAEAAAVMHLWRYIGWLMGVEDELMCDDEQQGRVLLYRNLISQAPPDDTSVVLARALMDEPLHRRYRWAAGLQGRFNRARHLSLVSWFIGQQGMRNLGLPPTLPWYPLMLMAPMALHSAALRLLPRLRAAWRYVARRQQTCYRQGLASADTPQPSLAAAGKQARL